MKHTRHIAISVAAAIVFAAAAEAQSTGSGPGMGHGPMMGQGMGMGHGVGGHGPMTGPTAMLTMQDANSAADMGVAMNLVHDNTKIRRTVTNLPDGIRTVTDAKVVAALQGHAGEVTELVQEGPTAFHRGMNARMAMGSGGPRGAMGAAARTGKPAQAQ